jgi:hypothetical protein
MSPSLSWLDPGEVARALARAGVAARPPSAGGFSGRPTHLPLVAALAARDGASASAEFEPREESLDRRLGTFARWVGERTGCQALFVIDQDGLLLVDQGADPAVVAISSSFMNLLERVHACLATPTEGSVAIDLDAGRLLHLLQAETYFGRYALGFVVMQPIDRGLLPRLKRGLARAMSGEGPAAVP